MATPEIFHDLPEQKLRPSTVYLNARRFGLSKEAARQCAGTWSNIFDTCFTQRVAGQFYNSSEVATIDFPTLMPAGQLFVTAHFSAYTFVSIALSKLYQRDIHIVVGKPSVEFESYLLNSLMDSNVTAKLIRSDFSQLRNIRRAVDSGAIVVSLIDVPWHRTVIPNREYEQFAFGAGKIMASRSIFKIAERLKLAPNFVLCQPNGKQFEVVNYGNMTQRDCFLTLAKEVERNPGHFERFCELHAYYKEGPTNGEVATFVLGGHRYITSPQDQKYWKLGATLTESIEQELRTGNVDGVTEMIRAQIRKVSAREYDEVVYF